MERFNAISFESVSRTRLQPWVLDAHGLRGKRNPNAIDFEKVEKVDKSIFSLDRSNQKWKIV